MKFNKKEYNAKYYQEHKEQFREYRKKYYQEHKKEAIERQKQWYQRHKKENQEYTKRWINKNNENRERFLNSIHKSRRKRVEKLREQGIGNAWDVVNYGKEPKYVIFKLYELSENQNIKLYFDDEVVIFGHIDGFYSYCWLEEDRNKIVHIKATTEFKKYKDGYKYIEKKEVKNEDNRTFE